MRKTGESEGNSLRTAETWPLQRDPLVLAVAMPLDPSGRESTERFLAKQLAALRDPQLSASSPGVITSQGTKNTRIRNEHKELSLQVEFLLRNFASREVEPIHSVQLQLHLVVLSSRCLQRDANLTVLPFYEVQMLKHKMSDIDSVSHKMLKKGKPMLRYAKCPCFPMIGFPMSSCS